jgi:hypothetical protein
MGLSMAVSVLRLVRTVGNPWHHGQNHLMATP